MTAATVPPDDQVPEAQIAVHWREEEYVQPPAKFIGQANASDPAIFERFSEDKFPECFRDYAVACQSQGTTLVASSMGPPRVHTGRLAR